MDDEQKRIVLKQVALYMVFLMLTLPLVSSQAFALSITKVTVTGSAGIEDVMQSENDYFIATVSTSEDVTPENLYISYTKDEAFDECTGSTCTYTSSQTDRGGQEMDYTIKLIDDSTIVDTVEGTILVDEKEPKITDYSVEKDEEGGITFSYEVEDTACDDCEECAGIDYLEFYDNGEFLDELNVASQCEIQDERTTSVAQLNLADGNHELCLVAVDNVGYESDQECVVLYIDSEGPHFETASLAILDAGSGSVVEYIGSSYLLVDVVIQVRDAQLSENTVYADLSALNAVLGTEYAEVAASYCEQDSEDEELWDCTWESYYIEGASGALLLKFWALDNEGNEGHYAPTYTLTVDDSPPEVHQVYTVDGLVGDDIYLGTGEQTLYVDIDPTGSAFSYEDVYLTFSKAGLTKEKVDSCSENGSYWTCVWNFTLSSSTASTTLQIDATDDAGNTMETYDLRVIVDDEEPTITGISTDLACPTAADTLTIEINATDDMSEELAVYVYGEKIRTSDDPILVDCNEYDEWKFTCLVTVDDFVSYPTDEEVLIEVVDLAGNIAEDELDIEVCELEDAGTPDFVELDVGDAGPVDLLTLSYMDVPIYVEVDFDMPSLASIVSKRVSCDATTVGYFLDEDDDSAIMVLYLHQGLEAPLTTSTLYLDCTMQLTMQYNDKVYSTPEVEEFELPVEVYGTPLGSIEASIQEKINLQVAGIQAAEQNIEKWVKWNRILGVLCKTANVMTKLDGIIAGLRAVATGIAVAVYKAIYVPPATFVATPIYEAMVTWNIWANTYHGIISKVVWPVGYFKLLSVGSVVKYGCIIYSGRLCEGFSTVQNELITRVGSAGGVGKAGTIPYYENNLDTEVQSGFLQDSGRGILFADWDPYRSIHTARACMYPDAIIYNLRKERQINCMYTTCLDESATNGLSTEICEVQFDQRQCLYVDGAAWRAMGARHEVLDFFKLVVNTIFSNIGIFFLSAKYTSSYCGTVWEGGSGVINDGSYMTNPYTSMISDTVCHVVAGGFQLMETGWFTEAFDWDFEANLEGTDYCVSYNGEPVVEETSDGA